jgi:hypothetical protein
MNTKTMLTLHPDILVKNGKKQFAVLPYEEFVALQDRLADAKDLLELRKAKRAEGDNRSIPLAEVRRRLGTS